MKNWNSELDQYTNNGLFYLNSESVNKDTQYSIEVHDSDIGRNVGFNRVAVHCVVVPPGKRTSLPHAENLEEEFVYVLKGNPHLWLNGYIHDLKPGHAVGFPAGTGIAHSFINNTNEDIHLIVVGDRSKNDNLCSFPINLEYKEKCPIWWEAPPKQELGPHNGAPGPVKETEKAKSLAECIVFCPDVEIGKSFTYPGDNESFDGGFRISSKVGLKSLGIWYQCLAPGRRTAFPHAHTHEEEFAYILIGNPTLWLNGFSKELKANEFAAFPSNTGISHTLINDTNEDVIYIGIGEATDFSDEKIIYPLHSLRAKECTRKGWYWLNPPVQQMGAHPGAPKNKFPDHLKLRLCSEKDSVEVLKLFMQSSDYFTKVEGQQPTLEITKKAIVDFPPTKKEFYFKEFLLAELNQEIVAAIDLHVNHPEKEICYIGLLLLPESKQGQGLGKKIYEFCEDYIKRALDCKTIKLGVSEANQVDDFWKKMGFSHNGKTYEWKGEQKINHVYEFEKSIASP